MATPSKSPLPTGSSVPLSNQRSKRFVAVFVAVVLASLAISLTTNFIRGPETEAVAATAAAGLKLADATGAPDAAAIKSYEPLDIVTAGGKSHFEVEVMKTPDQQARGLMFRRTLDDDKGMLFDFGIDRPVAMWMKNTYLPLDMVFINADGVIHRVEERTEPLSERVISSNGNVRAVLELNAGVARKLGLKGGDRIVHPMFPAK